jgi:hypothetical protein
MDDDEAAASDSDIADFLLDEDMIRAMDAIDQTVNPALLNLNGAPQPRDLSQILWFAIFKNDVAEVSRLIEAGIALPGSRVRYGSTALEMADRMGHREVVRLFCRDLNVAARGMGAILNAIHAGNRTTVRVVLEMGMRGIMAGNQLMTEIIFGYVAKYGTEAIFDVLHEYGPFFSWPEYTSWLLEQAADNDNFDVEGAIMRHRQAHLEVRPLFPLLALSSYYEALSQRPPFSRKLTSPAPVHADHGRHRPQRLEPERQRRRHPRGLSPSLLHRLPAHRNEIFLAAGGVQQQNPQSQ